MKRALLILLGVSAVGGVTWFFLDKKNKEKILKLFPDPAINEAKTQAVYNKINTELVAQGQTVQDLITRPKSSTKSFDRLPTAPIQRLPGDPQLKGLNGFL